jgi:hypothetical protein
MSIHDRIKAVLGDDETVQLATGLEAAFIGVGRQFNTPIAVYSRSKAIQCFIDQGMTEEEAEEYFEFNTAGAWIGNQTPIFMEDEPSHHNDQR